MSSPSTRPQASDKPRPNQRAGAGAPAGGASGAGDGRTNATSSPHQQNQHRRGAGHAARAHHGRDSSRKNNGDNGPAGLANLVGDMHIGGAPPDAQADYVALSTRLAAQEQHLHQQLQAQLGPAGARASGGATLPTLGEDTGADATQQPSSVPQRLAGSAAFQSAVARHAAGVTPEQRAHLAHQRQLSLQSRFAELGYGGARDVEEMTDDGSIATTADFTGNIQFDPTRIHRRTGSDMPASMGGGGGGGLGGFSPTGRLGHVHTASFGAAPQQMTGVTTVYAEQLALQQQIEMLQMQQQQLLQQQLNLATAAGLNQHQATAAHMMGSQSMQGLQQQQQQQQQQQHQQQQQQRQPLAGRMAGHRRIQSHVAGMSPASSAFNASGMGTIGSSPSNGSGGQAGVGGGAGQGGGQSGVPRGHGRRHSVNVVNKQAAPSAAPLETQPRQGPEMQANAAFSFPNHASAAANAAAAQAAAAQAAAAAAAAMPPPQPPAQAPSQLANMAGMGQLGQAGVAPAGAGLGHMSHPSVQLSALPPEYLLAAGGLVSFSALPMGGLGDLADGFGGAGGGGGGGRGGHNRQGSNNWRINGAPGPQPVDLAQAQAQLASLHHFRATGGAAPGVGGHGRNTSMGGGAGFNQMVHMGNQFGGGGGGGGGSAPQRKALFGSYLPQASLPPLLAAGKLVVGILRVNKRNRSDAWVRTEVLDSDIFISGSKDRNRALDGDVVAVELLDPQEVWSIKKEKEDKKRRKEEQQQLTGGGGGVGGGTAGGGSRSAPSRPDKIKDDLEVEGAQLKLVEDEEENDQSPPALAGHVVAIVERTPGQLYSGTLGLLRPSSAATKEKQQAERAAREGGDGTQGQQEPQGRPKIVWFRPTDKRVPLIAIPADQAPADFWEEGSQEIYNSRLFLASLKRWPSTSLHPFGTLVEEVGSIGNVEAETQALLKNNLASAAEEFGEAALKCLPPTPWAIPEREYEVRRDMRGSRVFSIDPETAKDLDDALSINELDGGLLEVGVHIADVSHFVRMGSALDRDARKRATSVYLVQRAIPMLPPVLSEELCSLVPGVERLCFSVVFTMSRDAHVVGTWFGRTVIRSCAKLAYSDAQTVIEGRDLDVAKLADPPSSEAKTDVAGLAEAVSADIRLLHDLAQKMRKRRFESGALRIDNVRLSFALDDQGLPLDASVYDQCESHELIQEFMVAANVAVATRIAAGLPEHALLRRHEGPLERRLEGFRARASQMGFEVDVSSAGALYQSLSRISDKKQRQALESLATKAMVKAKYVCCGLVDIAKLGHYALNIPLYTHFTSPIRRYADVMTHRQLEAVLQGQDKFAMDKESVAKVAQQCNVKRDAAKLAQEQSQHLFLCLMIHDLSLRYGPVIRTATVTGVLDAAFDVIVPEFGLEKRVHIDQMPVEHHMFDEHSTALSLYWKAGVDVIQWLADNSDDVHVKRMRDLQRALEMTSSRPHDDEAQLFEDEDEELARVQRQISSGEDAQGSAQRLKSFRFDKSQLVFDDVRTVQGGHKVQDVKLLSRLSVVISSDVTKSPPVIKVFAVNPFA